MKIKKKREKTVQTDNGSGSYSNECVFTRSTHTRAATTMKKRTKFNAYYMLLPEAEEMNIN